MNKNKNNHEKKKSFVSYTGLGFQMAGVFFIGIIGGKFLDDYFQFEKPYLTMVLTLVLFIGFMYKLYIDLTKN